MIRARRVTERVTMRASRSLSAGRRPGPRKPAGSSRTAKPARKAARSHAVAVEPVLFRFCKPGWAVLVERQPSQQGTRFVCPFCPQSHRVSGPVRGFRKVRRAQWIKLRRVDE